LLIGSLPVEKVWPANPSMAICEVQDVSELDIGVGEHKV
jgi:hypothetical protein